MVLHLRSLLPFAIPGVLALIGWWWFSPRKKERTSNHDRKDLAGVEEHGLGSPGRRDHCSREDVQTGNQQSLPLEVEQPAKAALTSKPSPGPRMLSPECKALGLDSSSDLPVAAESAIESGKIWDDSEKLETMVSQGVFESLLQESSVLVEQTSDNSACVEATSKETLASDQVDGQVPLMTSVVELPPGSPCLEKLGASIDGAAQNNLSEQSLKDDHQCLAAVPSECGSLRIPASEVAHETVPKVSVHPLETELKERGIEVESMVGVLINKCIESASSELAQKADMSNLNMGSPLKSLGIVDAGSVDSLEKERTGGVSLDKEVEKIEQVALHIISKVILAATEEVLSGSVSDVSDRICQISASCTDKSLEGLPLGTICQTQSSKGSEYISATVEPAPLSEENVVRHSMYSSHLMHGLLANPSHSQLRNSIHAERPGGHRLVVTNHDEELEDAHTATEDSGCSACTSEDGASMEDLLKSSLSPVSRQRLAALSMSVVKDSEHSSVQSQNPPSPTLPEDKMPYSNGVLKGSEQPWPAEADAYHSGGSDVNSMDSVDSGCALRKTDSCQNSKPTAESTKMDLIIWEVEVPKHLVGRLIGKQGRYVSFLKQTSGAKIYISTLPYTQDFQICHIEGSQQNVDKALNLIGKKFKDLSLTNIYAPPPPPLPLHSLPMTSWLMLPDGVTVEVIVVNQVNAGHLFVQQHTHPTFHVLRSLDQQMYLCYSQPGIPTMPTPVEVGVVCAAPGVEGAWWRAQVVAYFKDTSEVEIRYVDYGGYERIKIDTLRQIRSDFVTLPFQGAEVLLDSVVPLPDEDNFSSEADTAVGEMTRGAPLLAQVTNYDGATGLPLIQLWSMVGEELVSINRTLVERGYAQWVESYTENPPFFPN